MGIDNTMPDSSPIRLYEARCKAKDCGMLLARIWLEGASQVEIKCRRGRCGQISLFTVEEITRLEPDGQGGYNKILQ